jgi:hypothetical protein
MKLNEFNGKKLMDVGTRYQHMSELCEMWDDMSDIVLKRTAFISKFDKDKAEKMQEMAKAVRLVMQGLSDYQAEMSSIQWMVNTLNDVKGEDIHGGRGTELSGWEPGKPIGWGT